jgi:hypothetical protein
MDKWLELIIGPKPIMLGLIINTYRLTVAIPAKYLQEVLDLLNSTWHPNQRRFNVSEAQKLTGKLGHLVERANSFFSSAFPFVFIYCICTIREQENCN